MDNAAIVRDFYESILKLESVEECEKFFNDICTFKEIDTIAQRLTVARMVNEKKVYSDIVEETGASTATISRVKRALNYGTGGLKTVVEKTK